MDKIVLLKEGKTTLETGFPSILGLQPHGKAAMLGRGQNKRIIPRRIYMKIEFSSQRREMLLLLTTNMAAVTSRANTGLKLPCKANLVPRVLSVPVEWEGY